MTSSTAASRRPRAVTFAAWLHLVQAFLLIPFGMLELLDRGVWTPDRLPEALAVEAQRLDVLQASAWVVLGVLALLAAVGLAQLRPAAWLLAMALQGLNLAIALWGYLSGDPDYLTMAVGLVVVLALNQEEVRRAFEARRSRYG